MYRQQYNRKYKLHKYTDSPIHRLTDDLPTHW